MKKTILLTTLALTSALCADGDLAATQKMDTKSNQKAMPEQGMNVVTLTSARPESDNGWYLFADVLYWHASVGNTDWAAKFPDDNPPVLNQVTTIHHLDFKWSWGFKAGIGVNMDHDMWDSNLMYTWFRTHNSNSIGVTETQQEAAIYFPSIESVKSGHHKWDIHFSMFDWELGRWHYVSKNIGLRPHVGVKGGWIHQHRKTTMIAGMPLTERAFNMKNNFWGVGPSAGVNTMWILGNAGAAMDHRFSLFGDFGGAFMYGHFHTTQRGSTKTSTGVIHERISNLNRNLAVTMLQGIMGFSWDKAFNQGRNHFMMKLGYEFQYWFRQNQFPFTGDSGKGSSVRYSDDLALQGVTTEFRFDF